MDDYKNYIVIGHKYNGLGESAEKGSVDDWKPYIIFNNVKYDFNTEDEVKDFLSRNPSYLFRLKAIYKVKKLNINHFV